MTRVRRYLGSEDGAITVDWVVITAGIVGLTIGVLIVLSDNFASGADHIETELAETPGKVDEIQQTVIGDN